jgi:CyaY protein
MDETTFETSVRQVFRRLVAAADAADPDLVECDATSDMVTLSSPTSGAKVVVNTQRAVRQVWVAGKGVGVHFVLGPDGVWRDDKGQGFELESWVRGCVEAATGARL